MAKDPTTSEITELKKKLEENPDSLIFAPLADAYRKQGDLEEALNICKKGLEKHPNYTSARVVLGRIYQEQEKIEQATAEFKKVLETDSENLMAHSLLGTIYLARGDHQAAIEEYQKILTLNPDDEETQMALKQAIEKAAGEQKPGKQIKKEPSTAEKKNPIKESTASLTIAELYLKQGHFDKGIEVFQELLANDPQNLMLRQKLAEVVDRQQKESAVDTTVAKLKKSEFIQPPDHKEDVLEESRVDSKRPGKSKKEDDSKFTSDDILQVMRRGGKDDVVLEEKKNIVNANKSEQIPDGKITSTEKKEEIPLSSEKIGNIKGILAELGSVEGIMRCFITRDNGINVVSIGESSNNADLGKQAATIFDSTHRSVAHLNQGKVHQVLVTAESGHILLVSVANFFLIVLASSKINLGLLRLALDSSIKKLDRIL
jgi:tetratricopeptide (TPR) repeat protein